MIKQQYLALELMREQGFATTKTLSEYCRTSSPRDLIYKLRKKGVNIVGTWEKGKNADGTSVPFTRYTLKKEGV